MEGMGPISRKPGTGGHNKKRIGEFLDLLQEDINKDPTKSMRKMAAERNVVPITVNRAVHQDLGLKSFVRTPRHLLTATMEARR
ncbi:Uncharacterized protein FKW44_010852 [Caligus rogercresseyi]|uniref:Uncharacterized protein n=1 Tax=Caligus rogercresseyi TaxID=217165 RepID=A0A7T8K8D6_CALRO|nr:Uncharacterized protein FKW44_010852 [Caligus rogercresseyi]